LSLHREFVSPRRGGFAQRSALTSPIAHESDSLVTQTPSIGFIGSGQMASALAKAWTAARLIDITHSTTSDVSLAARTALAQSTGLKAADSNRDCAANKRIVLLAVKPQVMDGVLRELNSALDSDTVVVSIAAGITIAKLEAALGSTTRIIRVMPNTPCLVNASASAFAANANCTAADITLVQNLLEAVGLCVNVPEKLLDAVTGLSGSGPAYVFTMIDALADGGVLMGLPRDVALKLAVQTVFGSAKMMLETGSPPALLKDMVTSPGGTTIAGLKSLEDGAFRATVMDAVAAATMRATELGRY
jgi:pyrroline-5-carboxylate reductase